MNYEEIYAKMFNRPDYNLHNENEFRYQFTLNFIRENEDSINNLIDIGAGRGLFIKQVVDKFPHIEVTSTDINKFHNLDIAFRKLNLAKEDERQKFRNNHYTLLTCLDCLEHLEASLMEDVLEFFSKIASFAVFSIANHSDIIDGIELHVIQEDDNFWKKVIGKYFHIIHFQPYYDSRLYCFILENPVNTRRILKQC